MKTGKSIAFVAKIDELLEAFGVAKAQIADIVKASFALSRMDTIR